MPPPETQETNGATTGTNEGLPPPFMVPFRFLKMKQLEVHKREDVPHLRQTHVCLSHFGAEVYVELGSLPEDARNTQLSLWAAEHNRIKKDALQRAESALWVAIVGLCNAAGLRSEADDVFISKKDVFAFVKNPANYGEKHYDKVVKTVFDIKYDVGSDLDQRWYVDAEKEFCSRWNIFFDQSTKGGNRMYNSFQVAVRTSAAGVAKQIEKRELVGHQGKLVRKYGGAQLDKYWEVTDRFIPGCGGRVYKLQNGITRRQLDDTLKYIRPRSQDMDALEQMFCPPNSEGSAGWKARDMSNSPAMFGEFEAMAKRAGGKKRCIELMMNCMKQYVSLVVGFALVGIFSWSNIYASAAGMGTKPILSPKTRGAGP